MGSDSSTFLPRHVDVLPFQGCWRHWPELGLIINFENPLVMIRNGRLLNLVVFAAGTTDLGDWEAQAEFVQDQRVSLSSRQRRPASHPHHALDPSFAVLEAHVWGIIVRRFWLLESLVALVLEDILETLAFEAVSRGDHISDVNVLPATVLV